MKIIKKIIDVDKFHASEHVAYSSKKTLYILTESLLPIEVESLASTYSFELIDERVYYQTKTPGDLNRIDWGGNNHQILKANVYLLYVKHNKNLIACVREEAEGNYLDFFSKNDFSKSDYVKFPQGSLQIFVDDFLVYSNSKSVFCESSKGLNIWSKDLNPNERVKGPMHTWGDILIYCTQITDDLRGSYYVQACSLITGENLWREEGMTYFHQDSTTGNLFALCNSEFMAVQPNKGIIERYKHTLESDKGLFIHEHLTSYNDGRIYFTTDPIYKGSAFTGSFNAKTHEFEFVHSLNTQSGRHGGAGKPIVKNGKLYVLDSQKTLHIYAL